MQWSQKDDHKTKINTNLYAKEFFNQVVYNQG